MIQSDPAGQFVFHSDLGRDRIFIWKFDAEHGKLIENDPPSVAFRPAMGRGTSPSIPMAAGSIRCKRKPPRWPSSLTTRTSVG